MIEVNVSSHSISAIHSSLSFVFCISLSFVITVSCISSTKGASKTSSGQVELGKVELSKVCQGPCKPLVRPL